MHKTMMFVALLIVLILSVGIAHGEESAFAYQNELPDGAFFDSITCEAIQSTLYEYTASVIHNPSTSMVTCFQVYADHCIASKEEAWLKLQNLGLIDLAEANHAVIYLLSPANGEAYTEEDYIVWASLTKALNNAKDKVYTFDPIRQKFLQKKVYVIGEGSGADFIANYLHTDVASSLIAGELLVGASQAAESGVYAIPTYLVNCSEAVISLYKSVNDANTEEITNGLTVYYNSDYVMDSGYTPKRVIVNACDDKMLTAENVSAGWDKLLRHVWNDQLQYNYFTEGVECGVVSELPDLEALNLTFIEVSGEEAKNTTAGRWYEWVPNEVFETMKNKTDETYALIMINHGAGDHEIYEAESNGWVDLAGRERVIIVAARDIFQSGRPPESASTRYGQYNGEFIRNVICKKYPVDMSRIYIAGFSIGGFVTADTSSANPDLFAAAACMAYPGDGFMQIYPWKANGSDAEKYDIPVMYTCGSNDGNNLMTKPGSTPGDMRAEKVMSAQLMFNQILEFNGMEEQKIDLVDFDYDWYPGEKDKQGYDNWDGTAATFITQNLDFDAYPFYGYDIHVIPNTSFDTFTTTEGVEIERSVFYNASGWPMLEQLRMGDMGHYHYARYAQIIWDDFFSRYSRNPDTGELSYNAIQ